MSGHDPGVALHVHETHGDRLVELISELIDAVRGIREHMPAIIPQVEGGAALVFVSDPVPIPAQQKSRVSRASECTEDAYSALQYFTGQNGSPPPDPGQRSPTSPETSLETWQMV